MKRFTYLFYLFLFVLVSCNDDESDGGPADNGQDDGTSFGSYKYNGVEKEIVDAIFFLKGNGELFISIQDEDGRENAVRIPDFDGPGIYERLPFEESLESSIFFLTDENLPQYPFTADILTLVITDFTEGTLSGNFHFQYKNDQFSTFAECTDGEFSGVPVLDFVPAQNGSQFILGNSFVTIDSIHTRETNTFFIEAYVYGRTATERAVSQLFRFHPYYSDTSPNPFGVFFGSIDNAYQLNGNDDTALPVLNSEGFSTEPIGTEAEQVYIQFENTVVNELPKEFGQDEELLLYHGDDIISLEITETDVFFGADTVMKAVNDLGGFMVLKSTPSTGTFTGLTTSGKYIGEDIELHYYSSQNNEMPDWTVPGYLGVNYLENGIVNFGFETYYFAPEEIIPTYFRIKNYQM